MVKLKMTDAKHPYTWSKKLVESSFKMLEDRLDGLDVDNLNAQDKVLAELTMHNLFSSLMTACEIIRKIKEGVKLDVQ